MQFQKRRRLFRPERMLAFSDGVFAVAITLLVLDLRLPPLPSDSSAVVLQALVAMWPKLLIFCFTFLVVGWCWLTHHQRFNHIHQIDDGVLWLNLAYLMVLCLVPFATNVFSEHGSGVAFAFYTLVMALLTLLAALLAAYVLRPPFLNEAGIHSHVRQDRVLAPLSSSAIFLLATVLAASGRDSAAHWVLLLMLPVSFHTGRRADRAGDP